MKIYKKITAICCLYALIGSSNATVVDFNDSLSMDILVTESGVTPVPGPDFSGDVLAPGPLMRGISYSGFSSITSATLSVKMSDDTSTTRGSGSADIPSETARLNSVTGTRTLSPMLEEEIDANSGLVPGVVPAPGEPAFTIDDIRTSTPGTISEYFDLDVTSIVDLSGGTLLFELEALGIYQDFSPLLGSGGGLYIEDFIYNGATLTIEGTVVPVPSSFLLFGTALLSFITCKRRKVTLST